MNILLLAGVAIAAYLFTKGGGIGALGAPTEAVSAQQQNSVASQIANMQNAEAAAASQQTTQAAAQTFAGPSASTQVGGAAVSGAGAGLAAAPAIGILGASTLGFGAAAVAVWAILSRHHAQAVKNEARLLNTAYPIFQGDFDTIIKHFASKQITANEAYTLLDQARANYYTQVSGKGAGSIEGKWTWTKGPQMSVTGRKFPATSPSAFYYGKPNDFPVSKPHTCNGPCVVGHFWVEAPIEQAKEVISTTSDQNGIYNGSGQYKFGVGGAPAHAGYAGSQLVTYTL